MNRCRRDFHPKRIFHPAVTIASAVYGLFLAATLALCLYTANWPYACAIVLGLTTLAGLLILKRHRRQARQKWELYQSIPSYFGCGKPSCYLDLFLQEFLARAEADQREPRKPVLTDSSAASQTPQDRHHKAFTSPDVRQ